MGLAKKWTRSELIERIGDQNIFEYYFEQEINLNKCYQSVLREDNNFSTGFYLSNNGHLVYNDFATGAKLDCVAFVAAKFGVNYYKAADIIAVDFGLVEGLKTSHREAKIIKRKPLAKQERIIKILAKDFSARDKEYWAQYGVTIQELKDNFVYSVAGLLINDWEVPVEESEVRFAYLIKDGERHALKIYSPYSKEWKWVGNQLMTDLFGINDLPHMSKTLLICKSNKERIIAKKLFTDVIAIQAENTGAITKKIVEQLRLQYSRIIYFGDNDVAGLKFIEYMKEIGCEAYHFPVEFLTKFLIKDIGDFTQKWGVEMLKKWMAINIKPTYDS